MTHDESDISTAIGRCIIDANTRSVSEENTFTIDCKDVILREFTVTDLDHFHSLT